MFVFACRKCRFESTCGKATLSQRVASQCKVKCAQADIMTDSCVAGGGGADIGFFDSGNVLASGCDGVTGKNFRMFYCCYGSAVAAGAAFQP